MTITPEYFFTLIPFLIGTDFTLIGWLNLLRKYKMSKKGVLINSYVKLCLAKDQPSSWVGR